MAKPILFYALIRHGLYRRGFNVLSVTSEKGGQIYGRDEREGTTHVSERDVIYRFPEGTTFEFAKAATDRADREQERHALGIAKAESHLAGLRKARELAVLDAAKGLAPKGPCLKCGRASGDDGCDDQPCPMGLDYRKARDAGR